MMTKHDLIVQELDTIRYMLDHLPATPWHIGTLSERIDSCEIIDSQGSLIANVHHRRAEAFITKAPEIIEKLLKVAWAAAQDTQHVYSVYTGDIDKALEGLIKK